MTTELIRADGTPQVIADAMEAVQNMSLPIEDRAGLYAVLYTIQKRINRALGIRQKGATAQNELLMAMAQRDIKELGPLYLGWEAFDVKYPCNAAENWTDIDVQDALEAIRRDPLTSDYVRVIPAHLEIDVPALGEAVHAGSAPARALYDELRQKGWRTEGGRRASLQVREVTAPERKAA